MTEDRIRPAVLADAQGIGEVHVATWRVAYRGQLPQAYLDDLSVQDRVDSWRGILSAPIDTTLVAVDEPAGEIVGFVSVGGSRDDDASDAVGELRAIYLRPDRWNAGLGNRLHDAGLDRLRESFTEATLWVLTSNGRARHFYERLGWRLDGATKDVPRDVVTLSEVRYRQSLDSGA